MGIFFLPGRIRRGILLTPKTALGQCIEACSSDLNFVSFPSLNFLGVRLKVVGFDPVASDPFLATSYLQGLFFQGRSRLGPLAGKALRVFALQRLNYKHEDYGSLTGV